MSRLRWSRTKRRGQEIYPGVCVRRLKGNGAGKQGELKLRIFIVHVDATGERKCPLRWVPNLRVERRVQVELRNLPGSIALLWHLSEQFGRSRDSHNVEPVVPTHWVSHHAGGETMTPLGKATRIANAPYTFRVKKACLKGAGVIDKATSRAARPRRAPPTSPASA